MGNRFKNEPIEEQELFETPEEILPPEPKPQAPKGFLLTLFTEGVVSQEAVLAAMPFIVFLSLLGMAYIGNRHYAENNIRHIGELGKEVKLLSAEYKVLKAELMLKSTKSEIAKLVDTLGIVEPVEPPKKIVVKATDE
ncbi:MAG: FtsL-like putative cell division protein [Sphingobacteriaceae bacterium]